MSAKPAESVSHRSPLHPGYRERTHRCFHCVRGTNLFCENFGAHGVTMDGGFAECVALHHILSFWLTTAHSYASFDAAKCFQIHNLTDDEATLLEPASCAVHGLDKLSPKGMLLVHVLARPLI